MCIRDSIGSYSLFRWKNVFICFSRCGRKRSKKSHNKIKRKFLPNVSPNKTLEGFLIATLSTPLIVMPILALFYKYDFVKVLILIFLVSIFSVLGDATASLFKRISGVKDSSNIIPGHGGFFDRLDSHLAAAPCFVLLIYFMRGF